MVMLTYKVTEQKLNEHLGEPFASYFNLFKSKRFQRLFGVYGGICLLFSILFFLVWLWHIAILGLIAIIPTYILFSIIIRVNYRSEIAAKMGDLVNDPELLWVNSVKHRDIGHWQRSRKGGLSPITFKILRYLKKEGTSQGMYKAIKSMQGSNSAYQTLKRLANKEIFNKPIVQREYNDFKYIPWSFKLIDENNNAVNTKRAKMVETILDKCWEEFMDDKLQGDVN
jgi:phage shock protein PspC (stress-responsive transcriptional regulator)